MEDDNDIFKKIKIKKCISELDFTILNEMYSIESHENKLKIYQIISTYGTQEQKNTIINSMTSIVPNDEHMSFLKNKLVLAFETFKNVWTKHLELYSPPSVQTIETEEILLPPEPFPSTSEGIINEVIILPEVKIDPLPGTPAPIPDVKIDPLPGTPASIPDVKIDPLPGTPTPAPAPTTEVKIDLLPGTPTPAPFPDVKIDPLPGTRAPTPEVKIDPLPSKSAAPKKIPIVIKKLRAPMFKKQI
jgi:hypothetical protein